MDRGWGVKTLRNQRSNKAAVRRHTTVIIPNPLAAVTCSCYCIWYNKSCVSTDCVLTVACSTSTAGMSRLKIKERTCLLDPRIDGNTKVIPRGWIV
jgi:hypothetical protein